MARLRHQNYFMRTRILNNQSTYLFILLSTALVSPSHAKSTFNNFNLFHLPATVGVPYRYTGAAEELLLDWQNPATDQGDATRGLEKALLGSIYISQIKPGDMHAAYLKFMQNLKEKNSSWTSTDWENADKIINKLHFRRKAIQNKIGMDDMVKIMAIQVQYQALKTGNQLNSTGGSGN